MGRYELFEALVAPAQERVNRAVGVDEFRDAGNGLELANDSVLHAVYCGLQEAALLVGRIPKHRPGPHAYGRNHAEGANVLAEALAPFGGIVVWRCFVYNCLQDWRDRSTDRARAAYDTFMPLDGAFAENVVLQIKNGPMDFQVREPVSPLFGGLSRTDRVLELQITQEYTGQQRDLCYLVPLWREVLAFETHAEDCGNVAGSTVAELLASDRAGNSSGLAGIANVGSDSNWCGHHLAQANLYGYGRLAWDPSLSAERIAEEWIAMSFGREEQVLQTMGTLLLGSRESYERYTAPLGIGWMVQPGHHYGPNIDGYEYSRWGTYHFADREGLGVDRSEETGSGYVSQYNEPIRAKYGSLESCPDELLLFFHHVRYTHRLSTGTSVIQHIYDTHFGGVEDVEGMRADWCALDQLIDPRRHAEILERFDRQLENAREWRDVVNTYFLRKSGIPDERGRHIHP